MNSLKIRDLINIGVFTVIYFIIFYASGMVGFFGPAFIFVGGVFSTLLNGIVIMLLLARVPKIGTLTILGFLVGLGMAAGHTYWTIILALTVGIAADLINTKIGQDPHFHPHRAALSYAVFCLWGVAPFIPIFLDPTGYFAHIAQEMGADYSEGLRAITQPWVILLWALSAFLLGLAGGYLGIRATRKHFVRAGAVKTTR